MAHKASWVAGGVFAALGLTLWFAQIFNSSVNVSNMAFVTQSARSGDVLTWSSGWNYYIDLSLHKDLLNSNWVSYKYRLTIQNNGNVDATNFTVKDYLPQNSTFSSANNGGAYNNTNHTVSWFVTSLAVWQTQTMTVQVNRKNSWIMINKAEICAYEETGEPQDLDSNACTMGKNWDPIEDDEGAFRIGTGSSTWVSISGSVNDDPNPNGNSNVLTGWTGGNEWSGDNGSGLYSCIVNVNVTNMRAPGSIQFQVYPEQPYYPYSCSFHPIGSDYVYPLMVDPVWWYGSFSNIYADNYVLTCNTNAPNWATVTCSTYFSIQNVSGSGGNGSGGNGSWWFGRWGGSR